MFGPKTVDIRDAVQRWLSHEGYEFEKSSTEKDTAFEFAITNSGGPGGRMIVFGPKKQPDVLVIGARCPFRTAQNYRYKNFTKEQQDKVKDRIRNYCDELQAVCRFADDYGRHVTGVYTVLDKKEQHNQQSFLAALEKTAEMGDNVSLFQRKAL